MAKILINEIAQVTHPKEKLNNILIDSFSGSTLRIAKAFGEHIDFEQAKERSQTFKSFIDSLLSDKLI